MRSLHQVAASEIAVVPYYLKGYHQHGLQYDSQRDSRAQPLGAQCANCHTILWITGRSDPILFKEVNNQESYDDQHKRFLRSLPLCPNCHQQIYDLFVHNTTLTRFEDGSPYPKYPEEYYGVDEEMSAPVKDKAVWWYGDQAEAKRLNLKFL
ncbi:hypothetical protein RMB13_09495 [Acinetobacter sp. V102_4]|uniref:hypothetical protein n=1 Tax=Acinetobacter sp. V102_4 TaxID=3072984 RepID=UPI00287E6200|nr:hypothetical protein [Acinetobacter sp. V102_4]MDS7929708.1 hypothetical protein [Acinetobacter sp. V102_4]